jgi:hypothetical protein
MLKACTSSPSFRARFQAERKVYRLTGDALEKSAKE